MPDHVYICTRIPAQFAAASVIGILNCNIFQVGGSDHLMIKDHRGRVSKSEQSGSVLRGCRCDQMSGAQSRFIVQVAGLL
jgi:hypothetical protein